MGGFVPGISSTTEPIAGRVSIRTAEEIRRMAASENLTVSLMLKQLLADAVRRAHSDAHAGK
jgi:hypothetical protein